MPYYNNKKLSKIYEEIMVELYKNATPSADFKELVKNAPLNERGKRVIDFDSYEIEEAKANEIYDSIIKKHKVNHTANLQSLGFTVWLGCSPKIKRREEVELQENK